MFGGGDDHDDNHHHHHNMYNIRKLSADSSILTVHNAASVHSFRCAGVQTIS